MSSTPCRSAARESRRRPESRHGTQPVRGHEPRASLTPPRRRPARRRGGASTRAGREQALILRDVSQDQDNADEDQLPYRFTAHHVEPVRKGGDQDHADEGLGHAPLAPMSDVPPTTTAAMESNS